MRRIVPLVLAAAFLALPAFAHATAGDLDPTWGGTLGNLLGTVTTDVSTAADGINGLAIQPDGKIVAVGYAHVGAVPGLDQFAVTRYNADGSLDTSFAVASAVPGTTIVPLACTTIPARAGAVAIQPDGKIVVVGWGPNVNCTRDDLFTVMRLNPDGTVDTSFGGQNGDVPGTLTHQLRGQDGDAYAVVLQPAANALGFKIVAA